MKKLIIALLSVYVLSACQSSPIGSGDVDEKTGLSTQYSDGAVGKTAADINTELGAGYIGNGRYDRALIKLKKAVEQDPDHALAHNYLGVLYSRLERPDRAYQEFNKSVRLSPNDSTILNNYAIFLCEQEKYTEAQAQFKKTINNPLYINRAGAYQSAAWCASKNNDFEVSERLYRKALEMNSALPRSQLGLARIYYKQKNYKYAWNYFQRFDEGSVQDADSLWLGINILNKMPNPDTNLLSSYELLLKNKFPDSDEARWYYQGKQDY